MGIWNLFGIYCVENLYLIKFRRNYQIVVDGPAHLLTKIQKTNDSVSFHLDVKTRENYQECFILRGDLAASNSLRCFAAIAPDSPRPTP